MKRFTALTLFILTAFATLSAQQAAGWRGTNRDGQYNESGLLKAWPSEGPQLVWVTDQLGKSYSSPVIVNDRIFITGLNEAEDRELLTILDLNGKVLHRIDYGSPGHDSYNHARTTPTIVGKRAFVISGNGEVVCIDLANHSIVWSVDGEKTFNRQKGNWGVCESPLVYDNKVIYSPCGKQSLIVALDAQTGNTLWATPSPYSTRSSYTSPLLIEHKGRRQIVTTVEQAVIGINPDSGALEWQFDNFESKVNIRVSTNTPLYKDGMLFISNGYQIGSFMLKLKDDLSGVTLQWRNDDMGVHFGGYVLVDGVIYGTNWENNKKGNWVALDWKSGKTLYNTPWEGRTKGAIIASAQQLICYEEQRGYVGLVNANPSKFDLVSEFRITHGDGPHWAHPVIHNGTLYIRHGNALMAYLIK